MEHSSITARIPAALRAKLLQAAKKDGLRLSDFVRINLAKQIGFPLSEMGTTRLEEGKLRRKKGAA